MDIIDSITNNDSVYTSKIILLYTILSIIVAYNKSTPYKVLGK